jgi:SAM-dependent methyltransferase
MPRIDSEKFYLTSLKKHGQTPQGVQWLSQETQEIRFDAILDMLPQKIRSLGDAGCGFGDFYFYLKKKNRICEKYIGIDSLHKMCAIAAKKTKQEIIFADITKDSIPFCEYYICSGAMNILNDFETYLFIKNALRASKKAFVFNILNGEEQSNTYNYISKAKIQELAKELQIPKLIINDTYMKNDITVGFFH